MLGDLGQPVAINPAPKPSRLAPRTRVGPTTHSATSGRIRSRVSNIVQQSGSARGTNLLHPSHHGHGVADRADPRHGRPRQMGPATSSPLDLTSREKRPPHHPRAGRRDLVLTGRADPPGALSTARTSHLDHSRTLTTVTGFTWPGIVGPRAIVGTHRPNPGGGTSWGVPSHSQSWALVDKPPSSTVAFRSAAVGCRRLQHDVGVIDS